MLRSINHKVIYLCFLIILFFTYAKSSPIPKESVFDNELVKIKYNSLFNNNNPVLASDDNFVVGNDSVKFLNNHQYKSPAKAFFLSLALPGLGQFYYGSKVKPFIFLGVEATSWAYYFKWHNDGNDITDEFESFNRDHWIRDNYENKFLQWVAGVNDDNNVGTEFYEITHHLPDTRTQQYYEMTGKYDQFSWGWDDAVLNGNTIDDYSSSNPPPRVLNDSTTPYSANRLFYERRRKDANDKFDQAKKMVILSMTNRLISAFEAFFMTKHINKKMNHKESSLKRKSFSSMKFSAKLKSLHSKRDTPYLTFTYKF